MDDNISRQAAIDAVSDGLKGVFVEYRDVAEKMIGKLPTAERKGHWKGYIDNPDWLRTDGSPIFMSCSECNGTVLKTGSLYWNYCPECGADMR